MTSNRTNITLEFRKDLDWWEKYLPKFSGTGMLWMYHVKQPDYIAASDACLDGLGIVSDKEYGKMEFPAQVRSNNIAHLELWAIIVMCKVWIQKFHGKSVLFHCDNAAVVQVLNSGRAWDSELLRLMQELIFVAAGKFEFRAIHLSGKSNILPDLLSRWGEGARVHKKFHELIKGKNMIEVKIAPNVFTFTHKW